MSVRRFLASTALAGFVLLAGCSTPSVPNPLDRGPFFTPTNVRQNVSALPLDFRRVLLLPLAASGPSVPEANLQALDQVLRTELNRTARFEVVALDRNQLADLIGQRQVSSVDLLSAAFVEKLLTAQNRFGADGILFVDLTSYTPYPPLALGLRAKLVRLRDQNLLWSADLDFNTAQKAVANSALRYSSQIASNLGPVDLSHSILQTPTRFAEYCAYTTFATIPVR